MFLLAPEIFGSIASFFFLLYMEDLLSYSKRKIRTSDSDSEANSPEGKRLCNELTVEEEEEDAIMEDITKQLNLILSKLEGVETKLETVIETVSKLKSTVNDLENAVVKLQGDAKTLRNDVSAMDKGVSFLNNEVEELRSKEKDHLKRIKGLEDQLVYQELYNRRENLRFLGVPESMEDVEDTKETVYQLLERELGIEKARDIEFQRIHRIGKKSSEVRPIIARFLRFQERELIFKKAREVSASLTFTVLVDLPKEIRDRRKAQWPKLKKAREEGKSGYFSRREPDKLYIDGEYVPL